MSNLREILIVEDNPADIRLIKEALKTLTLRVNLSVVSDGDAAIRFLGRQEEYSDAPRPHLIFLDFNVPKTESREILKYVKQHAHLGGVPVAVLSTSEQPEPIREAYALGANCYLSKPLDLTDFLDTIRRAAEFWLNLTEQTE